jgi:hypothetical protein
MKGLSRPESQGYTSKLAIKHAVSLALTRPDNGVRTPRLSAARCAGREDPGKKFGGSFDLSKPRTLRVNFTFL